MGLFSKRKAAQKALLRSTSPAAKSNLENSTISTWVAAELFFMQNFESLGKRILTIAQTDEGRWTALTEDLNADRLHEYWIIEDKTLHPFSADLFQHCAAVARFDGKSLVDVESFGKPRARIDDTEFQPVIVDGTETPRMPHLRRDAKAIEFNLPQQKDPRDRSIHARKRRTLRSVVAEDKKAM